MDAGSAAILSTLITGYLAWEISSLGYRQQRKKEKEERKREMVEKITEKLLILDTHQDSLKRWIEKAMESQRKHTKFLYDSRIWSEKDKFDKNSELVSTWLYLYFSKEIQQKWNSCLEAMEQCFGQCLVVKSMIESGESPNWEKVAVEFNKGAEKMGSTPREIVDILKKDLKI